MKLWMFPYCILERWCNVSFKVYLLSIEIFFWFTCAVGILLKYSKHVLQSRRSTGPMMFLKSFKALFECQKLYYI